jgi:hypothetical protein
MPSGGKNVSMFVCLIKHHAIKKYWGVEEKLQANYFPYSWISVVQRMAHSMYSLAHSHMELSPS